MLMLLAELCRLLKRFAKNSLTSLSRPSRSETCTLCFMTKMTICLTLRRKTKSKNLKLIGKNSSSTPKRKDPQSTLNRPGSRKNFLKMSATSSLMSLNSNKTSTKMAPTIPKLPANLKKPSTSSRCSLKSTTFVTASTSRTTTERLCLVFRTRTIQNSSR